MKKGFTLVELLVVIALIAGISIVAVTSLIGIADKRKEESWDNVKSTVENAAKTYHKNNGYLFENLQDGYAWITVGKLVNEGYLNNVKDPRTGKELNRCSRVLIKIVDGHATYKYSDYTNGECDYAATLDSIEIRTINGPQASYKFYKDDDKTEAKRTNTGWFNIESLGGEGKKVKLCVKPKIPEGKTQENYIAYIQIGNDSEHKSCVEYGEGEYNNINLYLEDQDGGYWQKTVSFGVDTKRPSCKVTKKGTLGANNWYTSVVTITTENNNSDVISGIDDSKTKIATSEDGLKNASSSSGTQTNDTTGASWYGSITSNAGNKSDTCSTTVKKDTVTPTCRLNLSGTRVLDNDWYSSNVTITASLTNSPKSGLATAQVSTNKNSGFVNTGTQSTDTSTTGTAWYGKVVSGAGLSGTCGTFVKRDTIKPTVTISRPGNSTVFTGNGTDSGSGIIKYAITIKSTALSKTSSGWDKTTSAKSSVSYSDDINGLYYNINNAKDSGGNSTKTYYMQAMDNAGNVGVSGGRDRYQLCDAKTKKTASDEKDTTVAKVYKFESVVTSSSDGDYTNCTYGNNAPTTHFDSNNYKGPRVVYAFKEIQCDCNLDAVDNKYNCGYVDYHDITAKTHEEHSDGKKHTHVIYQNTVAGHNACENRATYQVKRVCEYGSIGTSTSYHGIYWTNGTNNSNNNNQLGINGISGKWFHSGGGLASRVDTVSTSESSAVVKACKKACRYKFNDKSKDGYQYEDGIVTAK